MIERAKLRFILRLAGEAFFESKVWELKRTISLVFAREWEWEVSSTGGKERECVSFKKLVCFMFINWIMWNNINSSSDRLRLSPVDSDSL